MRPSIHYAAPMLMAALAACSGDKTPIDVDGPVTLALDSATVDLFVSEEAAVGAYPSDAQGNLISVGVSWSSSNPTVATVSEGVVRGISAGETTIRAAVDDLAASATVRVADPLSLIVPLEGIPNEDYYLNRYVAHQDERGDSHDFQCGDKAAQGGAGTDFVLPDAQMLYATRPTVRAAAAGTVIEVLDGSNNFSIANDTTAPANRVVLDHGQGRRTVYDGFWPYTLLVEEGDAVSQGDVLGTMGSSGPSGLPWVHFEVRLNDRVVDPYAGPCSGPISHWSTPMGYEDGYKLLRARVSDYQLAAPLHLGVDAPREADTIYLGRTFTAWVQEVNADPDAQYFLRLVHAEGTTVIEKRDYHPVDPRGITWSSLRPGGNVFTTPGTYVMEFGYGADVLARDTFVVANAPEGGPG